MEWITKNGQPGNLLDMPRLLTHDEIENILQKRPSVRGLTDAVVSAGNINIGKFLRSQLETIELAPSGIDDLIRRIQIRFERARVEPESAVGISAAEAIGRSSTQSALNSFHVAGSTKNVSYGLSGLQELINATKNRKNISSTIVFKDKGMSYMETLRKRRDIVGITVGALVKDYQIDPPEKFEKYPWEGMYSIVMNKKIPKTTYMLRLYFDLNMLYQYHVTLEKIAQVIEEAKDVTCVNSPLPFITPNGRFAIVDVYPDESSVYAALEKRKITNVENKSMVFLDLIVRSNLNDLVIQGVPGITAIFPVYVPVLRMVSKAELAFIEEEYEGVTEKKTIDAMKRTWFLIYNKSEMKLTGLQVENLINLVKTLGMKVEEEGSTDSYLMVRMPKGNYGSPLGFISKSISETEKQEVGDIEENRRKGIFVEPMDNPLIKVSRFYTVDTNGSNLLELLARSDVDYRYTYSNDFHEMTHVFGVDVARTYHMRELSNNIKASGSYVNPHHIELICALIYHRGVPKGLTFAGISAQPIGTLALASIQKSVEVFQRAALYGKTEKITDTSASIYIGKRIDIGTGAFDVNIDHEKLRKYEAELKEVSEIAPDVLETGIAEFEKQAYGNNAFTFKTDGESEEGIIGRESHIDTNDQVISRSGPIDRPVKVVAGKSGVTIQAPKTSNLISNELAATFKMLSNLPAMPTVHNKYVIRSLKTGLLPDKDIEPPLQLGIQTQMNFDTSTLPRFTFKDSWDFRSIKEVKMFVLDLSNVKAEDFLVY